MSGEREGGEGLRRYFAYGANMDPVHMAKQCPGARRIGLAVLRDHEFRIAREGFGNAAASPGRDIPGVFWELTPADEAALDEFEGVPEGHYRKETASVEASDGGTFEAMLYRPTDPSPGVPRPGYLEGIIAVAGELGFPAEYLESLRRLLAPTG